MKHKLINTLTGCGFVEGVTLFLQGTLAADEAYPATFVTIWTDYTADNSHFDNETSAVDWHFTVIVYSSDASVLEEKSNEVRTALRAAGFIPQGKGQDIPSDEETHTGWAMEFLCVENL